MWKDKREKEIEVLFELLTKTYTITKEDILSKSRKRELVFARRFLMNLLADQFASDDFTHNDIASVVDRNRLSFIHHRNEHKNFCDTDKKYNEEYDILKTEYAEKVKVINS